MPAVHIQPAQPRAGHIRYLPRIPAQYCIGFGKRLRVGNGPDDRQVIRAGAAKGGTALERFGLQGLGVQASRQVWGRPLSLRSSTDVRGDKARSLAPSTSTKQVMHWPQPPQFPSFPLRP